MANYLQFNRAIFCEKHWRSNDRRRGILIDSETYPKSLRYLIKDQYLILLSGFHGAFCFDLAAGPILLNEIGALIDCYQLDESQAATPRTLGEKIGVVLQIPTD